MKKTGYLKADRVIFTNGDMPAEDVVFTINPAGFVIITKDEDDDRSVWYNTDVIEKLEGVQMVHRRSRGIAVP